MAVKYNEKDLSSQLKFLQDNAKFHPQSKGTQRINLEKSAIYKLYKDAGFSKENVDKFTEVGSKLLAASVLFSLDHLKNQAEVMHGMEALDKTTIGVKLPIVGPGGSDVEAGLRIERTSLVPQDKERVVTKYGVPYVKSKTKVAIDEPTKDKISDEARKIRDSISKITDSIPKNMKTAA
jgi:hypothetical protein